MPLTRHRVPGASSQSPQASRSTPSKPPAGTVRMPRVEARWSSTAPSGAMRAARREDVPQSTATRFRMGATPVIPAKAGTQSVQEVGGRRPLVKALGPRLRGDDGRKSVVVPRHEGAALADEE